MKYLIKYNTLKLNAEITERNLLKELKKTIDEREALREDKRKLLKNNTELRKKIKELQAINKQVEELGWNK